MNIVTCSGVDDTAAVQAALNAGGEVKIIGPKCKVTAALNFVLPDTALYLGCDIEATGLPVGIQIKGGAHNSFIESDGVIRSIRTDPVADTIRFGEAGPAGFVGKARTGYIRPDGGGIRLLNGAGFFNTGALYLNGYPNNNSRAISIEKWDSAFLGKVIAEEHDHGLRMWDGANIWADSLVLDRLKLGTGFGLWFEPSPGKQVCNVQINSVWASGGRNPIFINTTDGPVKNIQIGLGYYTDFRTKTNWIAGVPVNFKEVSRISV